MINFPIESERNKEGYFLKLNSFRINRYEKFRFIKYKITLKKGIETFANDSLFNSNKGGHH